MQKIILTLAVSSCFWASSAFSAEDDSVVLGYSTLENTELIALEPQLSVDPEGGIGYGAGMRLVTLKWNYFILTLFEFGHGITGEGIYTYAGSRPGFPLYFGENGRHQLRFGLGIDFAVTFVRNIEGAGLFVSPSAHYIYQTSGSVFFGVGVSAFMFAAGGRKKYPFFLLITANIGFSSDLSFWKRSFFDW